MPSYTKAALASSRERNNNSQNSINAPVSSSCSPDQPVEKDRQHLEQVDTSGLRRVSSHGSDQSSVSSQDSSESRLLSSNADYDHIRNTTLMFFLDRLFLASKEGKEARTLHDLSCLFGTKDFTKEMRQIVGASRNGLRKFLQAYPSLFTIDGDKVYLTQLEQENSQSSRDYNKEAVEYFKQKLVQFGASLVPIKNLFGYRSQASQEVRHVSGKNSKEFRQFLSNHEDVFELVADEHVILKSALAELEAQSENGGQHSSLQPVSLGCQLLPPTEDQVIDPYLNKQFAHIVENSLKGLLVERACLPIDDRQDANQDEASQRGVPIEFLYDAIVKECKNQLFLKMVKTTDEFKVFLRTHPKIFKRSRCESEQCDYVTLLTEQERRELEAQSFPVHHPKQQQQQQQQSFAAPTRQHPTLKRSETNISQTSDKQQPLSLTTCSTPIGSTNPPPSSNTHLTETNNRSKREANSIGYTPVITPCLSGANQAASARKPDKCMDREKLTSQPSSTSLSKDSDKKSLDLTQVHQVKAVPPDPQVVAGSALRASAPPFVPPSLQQAVRLGSGVHLSKVGNDNVTVFPSYQQQKHQAGRGGLQRSKSNLNSASAPLDARHSLRSYLIKATANNSANSLYSPNKQSNGASYLANTVVINGTTTTNTNPRQQPAALVRQSSAINKDDLRARTIDIVREASNIIARIMNTSEAVAFDCKGFNLDFNGQITLIQFAFLPGRTSTANIVDKRLGIELNQTPISQQELEDRVKTVDERENRAPAGVGGSSAAKQKPEVCIFDLITNPELAYCLKPLLESDKIVKIVHDVRSKSCALHSQFGIMLNQVFDTQVANLVIQQQETGRPAYKSRYISMDKLCEVYGNEDLVKYRNLIRSRTRHNGIAQSLASNKMKDVNYWRQRPLTEAMVYESTMDVYCLIGGVYQNLRSQIQPEYWPLFDQLNMEGVLARIKPDEIRSVKKERKIDLEVIDLKRKLYANTSCPIVLSNREVRLLRHIDLTEEVRNKIKQCKKVAKKLERLDMKAAQNSQSLNGENSKADNYSLDPANQSLVTNGSDSSTSSSTSLSGQPDQMSVHQDAQSTDRDPLDVTGLSNLMDSSMFDELKDKMIESSSLLESLDDDDDLNIDSNPHMAAFRSVGVSHAGPCSLNTCTCSCHSQSGQSGDSVEAGADKTCPSLKSSISDKEEGTLESRGVDMAIQCDLLN